MPMEGKVAFEAMSRLKCPDCGGKLLRGPRALHMNQNLTCGDCHMKFNATYLDKEIQRPFRRPLPESDTEFREHAMVIAFERLGQDDAQAAFYDPSCLPQICEYEPCSEQFTGPALYCCICCAISDA